MYVLHNYFRSSTSFRVRIALNLKSQPFEYRSYQLLKGEHKGDSYLSMNPDGLVPTLETTDGYLGQSLAILEYLDEVHPEPPLLPDDAVGRARVRSLAHAIALDIHPVNNLRVLQYLKGSFEATESDIKQWFSHWVSESFSAIESRLSSDDATGPFCHGASPGMADICLVAQAVNNTRFDVPMQRYPTIGRIVATCLELPAFADAHPARQPDAF